LAKQPSRLLVIDASIARAAGDPACHPTSLRCRDFLLAVLEICHRLVMTAPIQEEWNKHQSRFARKWRLSMMARRKVEIVEIQVSASLERRFPKVVASPFILAIMEKDRRLIEAALFSDHRIASLDEAVRRHFRNHGERLPELRKICWINPDAVDDACDWLKNGAPAERARMLDYSPP
jgi:hypothetical protein